MISNALLLIYIMLLFGNTGGENRTLCQCLNSKLCLFASSDLCEAKFCVDKTYYELEDTIYFNIKIKNVSDTSFLVENPECYPEDYILGCDSIGCNISIGEDDPGHFSSTFRKLKLAPSDSVCYQFCLPITGKPTFEYNIEFGFWGYAYIDELEYLTEGSDCSVGIDSVQHILHLTTRYFYLKPGQLKIYIGWDVENINFFYPPKKR